MVTRGDRINLIKKYENFSTLDESNQNHLQSIKEYLVKNEMYSKGTGIYLSDKAIYNMVLEAKGLRPYRLRVKGKK